MTDFVNYGQILTDIVSLVTAKVTDFKLVGRNLDTRDFHFANTPLCDIRASGGVPEVLAGQNYYVAAVFEIEMAAHSLKSQDEAATIILNLLNKTQRAFVENSHYSASWDSVILGSFDVVTGEESDPKRGAFVASAVMKVTVNVYSQG